MDEVKGTSLSSTWPSLHCLNQGIFRINIVEGCSRDETQETEGKKNKGIKLLSTKNYELFRLGKRQQLLYSLIQFICYTREGADEKLGSSRQGCRSERWSCRKKGAMYREGWGWKGRERLLWYRQRLTVELAPVRGRGRMLKKEVGHRHNLAALQT